MTVQLQTRYRYEQRVGADLAAVVSDAAHGNGRRRCNAGKAESVRELRQQVCQRSFTVIYGCGYAGGLGV